MTTFHFTEQTKDFSAINGYFHIDTGVSGCFSQEQITAEIKFGESDQIMVTINYRQLSQTRILEARIVHDLLRRILEAAHKPEVSSGTRMTTWYFANLVWKNLYLDNYDLSGELKFEGIELRPEDHEEDLAAGGPRAELLKSLFEKELHCRAMKIYDIASEFAESIAYLHRHDE